MYLIQWKKKKKKTVSTSEASLPDESCLFHHGPGRERLRGKTKHDFFPFTFFFFGMASCKVFFFFLSETKKITHTFTQEEKKKKKKPIVFLFMLQGQMRGLGFAGKRCSLVALLRMICQRENE